jgi:hypothetical protein
MNEEKSTTSLRLNIKELQRALDTIKGNSDIGTNFYNSVAKIIELYEAILDHDGQEGWSSGIVPAQEQEEFEREMKPIVDFFLNIEMDSKQTGGNGSGIESLNKMTEGIEKLKNPKNALKQAIPGLGAASDLASKGQNLLKNPMSGLSSLTNGIRGEDMTPTFPGPDELFDMIINKMNEFDNQAKKYGLFIDREKAIATKPDIPVPNPLFPMFAIPPPSIPVPVNSMLFFGYMLLDIARLAVSNSYIDIKFLRVLLSLVLSIIDILRGNWKKSLLAFAGVFGKYQVYIGAVGRFGLDMISLLSPDLRETLLYNSFGILKSFIIGSLLSLFHTFAPYQLRQPVVQAIASMNDLIDKLNTNLESSELPKLPEYLEVDFRNLQDIQVFFSDPRITCTKEFQDLVGLLSISSIIRVVFQLLRVPMTRQQLKQLCPKDMEIPAPAVDVIVAKQMELQNKEQQMETEQYNNIPQNEIQEPDVSKTSEMKEKISDSIENIPIESNNSKNESMLKQSANVVNNIKPKNSAKLNRNNKNKNSNTQEPIKANNVEVSMNEPINSAMNSLESLKNKPTEESMSKK